MKKIIIAMAAIVAAFTMASCNKEQPVSPNDNPTTGKSVITASIENDLTKTSLEGNDDEGYKVFWSKGDNLFVCDEGGSRDMNWVAEYKLEDSSIGSSKGIFSWHTGDYFIPVNKSYQEPLIENGNVYVATHPFDLIDPDNFRLIWKTEQTYSTTDRYIPMCAVAECTKDGEADFKFTNLGGMLRLTVKGSAYIRSVKISAAEYEAMSGSFHVYNDDNDNMVGRMEDGDDDDVENYIILNCGTNGVRLSEEGTDFYISMPCHYIMDEEILEWVLAGYSDVTITLTDTEGRTCVKKLNNKKLFIERSKITTATFTASEFKANVPEGALPGKFTINEAGDQVYFSQGNLYWDGSAFKFEDSQTGFASEWDAEHVSHFFWSKDADVAVSETYYDPDAQDDDVFFTNETENTAKADFTVNGVTGKYRALSHNEWKYLIEERIVNGSAGEDKSYSHAKYGDIYGLILYPDDYNGPVISGETSTLPTGCVFLPAAGYRGKDEDSTELFEIGEVGCYNSSTYGAEYCAVYMLLFFGEDDYYMVSADANDQRGTEPMSSRLVTDVTE